MHWTALDWLWCRLRQAGHRHDSEREQAGGNQTRIFLFMVHLPC